MNFVDQYECKKLNNMFFIGVQEDENRNLGLSYEWEATGSLMLQSESNIDCFEVYTSQEGHCLLLQVKHMPLCDPEVDPSYATMIHVKKSAVMCDSE